MQFNASLNESINFLEKMYFYWPHIFGIVYRNCCWLKNKVISSLNLSQVESEIFITLQP